MEVQASEVGFDALVVGRGWDWSLEPGWKPGDFAFPVCRANASGAQGRVGCWGVIGREGV